MSTDNDDNVIDTLPPRLTVIMPPFKLVPSLKFYTKKNFEMVISRYDEDISWSKNYIQFRTIYNKGKPFDDTSIHYIPRKNVGHLAETILHHIITNYDHLATTTFFTHGSFNYRNDQIIKERSYKE